MTTFYLREADTTSGQQLTFCAGDIVLIVGPNNSGKSTFLREVKGFIKDSSAPRKLFSRLSFNVPNPTELLARIGSVFRVVDLNGMLYTLDERGMHDFPIHLDRISAENLRLQNVADAFAILLDGETRLRLSRPADTIDISVHLPRHPYHHFMLDRQKLRKFSKVVQEAFGLLFTIVRVGNPIRGYVGTKIDLESDSLEADKIIPQVAEHLDAQGDGIRSYVGIAAEIQGAPYPITLLDEPEAFLHPPQAKKLGRLIPEALPTNSQAFIATHSSDFLQGILHSKPSRVRVLRLDRSGGALEIKSLVNTQLNDAVSHPSIANSNMLDALFFSQTVICEGDADCSLFDWATRELGNESIRSKDRFWFAAGGKHQVPKLAKLLNDFGVDFRIILDLDAITEWALIEQLAALKGLNVSQYKKRIAAALKALQRPPVGQLTAELKEIMDHTKAATEAEERELVRAVQRALEKGRRSYPLKQHGVSAVPRGQEQAEFRAFLELLQSVGIALLRKGELESYVPEVGLHGPGWMNEVLKDRAKHEAGLRELLGDVEVALR
jgi:hypothetical protein